MTHMGPQTCDGNRRPGFLEGCAISEGHQPLPRHHSSTATWARGHGARRAKGGGGTTHRRARSADCPIGTRRAAMMAQHELRCSLRTLGPSERVDPPRAPFVRGTSGWWRFARGRPPTEHGNSNSGRLAMPEDLTDSSMPACRHPFSARICVNRDRQLCVVAAGAAPAQTPQPWVASAFAETSGPLRWAARAARTAGVRDDAGV